MTSTPLLLPSFVFWTTLITTLARE
ncbi:hypothetical protein FOXYSP1_14322 [Fusarium oxysporum f. sp. phaseoli]